MKRCVTHIDPTHWIYGSPVGGRARVICRLCGCFIGYLPPEQERRRRQRTIDDSDKMLDNQDDPRLDFDD